MRPASVAGLSDPFLRVRHTGPAARPGLPEAPAHPRDCLAAPRAKRHRDADTPDT